MPALNFRYKRNRTGSICTRTNKLNIKSMSNVKINTRDVSTINHSQVLIDMNMTRLLQIVLCNLSIHPFLLSSRIKTIQGLIQLFTKESSLVLFIFGSIKTGLLTPFSDIDILFIDKLNDRIPHTTAVCYESLLNSMNNCHSSFSNDFKTQIESLLFNYHIFNSKSTEWLPSLSKPILPRCLKFKSAPHLTTTTNLESNHPLLSTINKICRSSSVFTSTIYLKHARVPIIKTSYKSTKIPLDISVSIEGYTTSKILQIYFKDQISPTQFILNTETSIPVGYKYCCRMVIIAMKMILYNYRLHEGASQGLGTFPLSCLAITFFEHIVQYAVAPHHHAHLFLLLRLFFYFIYHSFDFTHPLEIYYDLKTYSIVPAHAILATQSSDSTLHSFNADNDTKVDAYTNEERELFLNIFPGVNYREYLKQLHLMYHKSEVSKQITIYLHGIKQQDGYPVLFKSYWNVASACHKYDQIRNLCKIQFQEVLSLFKNKPENTHTKPNYTEKEAIFFITNMLGLHNYQSLNYSYSTSRKQYNLFDTLNIVSHSKISKPHTLVANLEIDIYNGF